MVVASQKRRNNGSMRLDSGRRVKSRHFNKHQLQRNKLLIRNRQIPQQSQKDDVHETKGNEIPSSSNNNQQQRFHHHRLPHHSHHPGSGDGGNGNGNGIRNNRFSSSDNHNSVTTNNGKQLHTLSNSLNPRNSHSNSHNMTNQHNRRKALDPTLLARGMSSRSIGARVSSQIRSLSHEEMEKDVRHMEVFGTACIAYAQQFFIYTNRDSVSRGVYGPVPSPSPGLLAHHPGHPDPPPNDADDPDDAPDNPATDGITDGFGEDDSPTAGPQRIVSNDSPSFTYQPHTVSSSSSSGGVGAKTKKSSKGMVPGGGITMPVRIDPEEEKRLSILRKRVAASEAKREVLETEYLSLLAHYVHEIHILRHARRNTDGQLGLLKELSRRRGKVLALRRVRVAIGRDLFNCLQYRKANAATGGATGTGGGGSNIDDDKERVGVLTAAVDTSSPDPTTDDKTTTTTTTTTKEDAISDKIPQDLKDIWTTIEIDLQMAELECSEVETPKELFQVKSALSTAVAAARNSNGSGASSSSEKNGNHSTKASSYSSSSNATSKNSSATPSDITEPPASNSLSPLQRSSSFQQQQHQRRSRSPSRSKEGKQHHDNQDTDNDGNASGSGSASGSASGSVSGSGGSNNENLTKKKGTKGESSMQDAKGIAGKQSNTASSIGEGENHNNGNNSSSSSNNNNNNNNNNKKSNSNKPNKKNTSNNNTNTVTENSSPCPEGEGVTDSSPSGSNVVEDGGASTTTTATVTTAGPSSKNTHTKSKRRQSISYQNVNGDDRDDNVIPWSCQIMPRTPYDVSVFISNLSSVPDGSAAFGCGNIFGNDDSSMIWLESNVPKPSCPHTSSKMQSELQNLIRLRREVQELSEKLDEDVIKNRELQKDLICNRKRSDELSAMISMLRTETEAVLNRHNSILETPEARELAADLLHAKSVSKAEAGDGIEEDMESNSDEVDDDEMDDEDEDDEELDEKDNKSSDGGTVIEDEEGEGGGMNPYAATDAGLEDIHTDPGDSVEEGEIHEEVSDVRKFHLGPFEGGDIDDEHGEDEEDEEGYIDQTDIDIVKTGSRHLQQPMKEVIVSRLISGGDEVEEEGGSAVVDEEDGEINEDYSTISGFEVGKRGFSEVSDGGSGEVDSTTSLPENDPDKKRRKV